MSAEQKLEHGRYLTTVMGCNDCHTPAALYGAPDTTRRLAGSELGWQGPWGVTFARNLTSDTETGLGSWTEGQIVTAIREGRRPDGTPLLPPMPWPSFAHLTDADANAIAFYIKSVPAVRHVNLKQVPPGQPFTGAALTFPPPPAWDTPKGPPPAEAMPDSAK
jgi:mono/diheme cytochrome c family protein